MSNALEEARRLINDVDTQMAELFVKRMDAVRQIYAYKEKNGLPIADVQREREVMARNGALVDDPVLKRYYSDYLQQVMAVSRAYQSQLRKESESTCDEGAVAERGTILPVCLGENSYDIVVERGALAKAGQYLHLNRKVLIVTDSGVPRQYAQTVAEQCRDVVIYTVAAGETSKCLDTYAELQKTMLEQGFQRADCVIAVGGGVVGDLAGFAASTYMRGIDFYNIPTTLLSQIDSSIGGKTAVNFGGIKNVVGSFYQPKTVLIDPDLLSTLPPRQMANGLAEAIKMAMTSDRDLFELMEERDIAASLDEIILRSLRIKKNVVERDEKENNLRRILNFGHTIGHGIESSVEGATLFHGECVALGMLPMCAEAIRPRLIAMLKKCHLYPEVTLDWDAIAKAVSHDKKGAEEGLAVVTVNEIGNFDMETMSHSKIIQLAKTCLGGEAE